MPAERDSNACWVRQSPPECKCQASCSECTAMAQSVQSKLHAPRAADHATRCSDQQDHAFRESLWCAPYEVQQIGDGCITEFVLDVQKPAVKPMVCSNPSELTSCFFRCLRSCKQLLAQGCPLVPLCDECTQHLQQPSALASFFEGHWPCSAGPRYSS